MVIVPEFCSADSNVSVVSPDFLSLRHPYRSSVGNEFSKSLLTSFREKGVKAADACGLPADKPQSAERRLLRNPDHINAYTMIRNA